MKTIEELLTYKSRSFDGRDMSRLCTYFTSEQIESLGFEFNSPETRKEHKPKELTRDSLLLALRGDLDFAFEKAHDGRGLSAAAMTCVTSMWVWALGDEETVGTVEDVGYEPYGLPYLRAVADFYEFRISSDC
ncbi:hypothetical protein [Vibrio crassostreae]|uniref:hypothetical protein n=1 Tax=Vibrio crassostreae TaxID=246167 RepID=UPI001B304D17|nr:hypothetical protein [Vibrio crassostreae]